MKKHARGSIAMTVLIVPLVACSSSAGGGGGGTQNTPDGGPAPHTMGASCSADSDCPSGELCLSPAIGAGTDKYCAPSCSQQSDCTAFAETSYTFDVPDTVTPQGGSPTPTVWKSKVLNRGTACAPVNGESSKYCQFACSDTEALSADGHCYCLPGYELNADKTACVFAQDVQCSVLSFLSAADQQKVKTAYGIEIANTTCDACDSNTSYTSQLGCHTGLFGCEINDVGLKGRCAEIITPSALNQCISNATNFTCDCNNSCSNGCDPNEVACIYDCCTCTAAPGSPAPTCSSQSMDGGAGDAAADAAADGAGDEAGDAAADADAAGTGAE